jgi:S1-C subfamily serine protease
MMPHSLEAGTIRILDLNGTAIGAGFLVADGHAVTCAHVVASALGLQRAPGSKPQAEIKLDFPLLAAGKIISARVIAWGAAEDIAVLELRREIPSEVQPAELFHGDNLWEHPFRTFGFPSGFDNGVWASGRILAREATGWLQIEDTKQTGYFVQPGFSGAPVWDEQLGGVIGMTVAADTRSGVRAAFVLPVKTLATVWPELEKRVREAPSPTADVPAPGEAPFKGLQYFDVYDAPLFFGRANLTATLLEHIRTQPFLAVVGTSGSGKSSVVRAWWRPCRINRAGAATL